MNLRTPTKSDFQQIFEIFNGSRPEYHFDPFETNTVLEDAVAVKDDKVIAYGMVKIFAEAVLLMDPKAGKLDKTRALKDLILLAEKSTKDRNIASLHLFASDLRFVNLLKEQFGYMQINSTPLVKDL